MSYNPYGNNYTNTQNANYQNYGYPQQPNPQQHQHVQQQTAHPAHGQYPPNQVPAQHGYHLPQQSAGAGGYRHPQQQPTYMTNTHYQYPTYPPQPPQQASHAHPSVVIPQPSRPPTYSPSPIYYTPPTATQYQPNTWTAQELRYQQSAIPQASPRIAAPQHYPQPEQYSQHAPQIMPSQKRSSIPSDKLAQNHTVNYPIVKPQPSPKMAHPQVEVKTKPKPSPVTAAKPIPQPSAKPTAAEAAQKQEADWHILLLSLAEEYITAAYKLAPRVALLQDANDQEMYYKLMATGMGCLEKAMNMGRPTPRTQAHLLLQYANLLYSETDNKLELETALSKGIPIAERNKMLDLKYSMEYLSVLAVSRNKPSAGLNALEKHINLASMQGHTPWVYAFRFLQIHLCLQAGESAQLRAATRTAKDLQTLAQSHNDYGILVTAATMEAMLHLRSGSVDLVQNAQHAIANARTWQLQDSKATAPAQIWALLDCVELLCSLLQYSAEQATQKMEILQKYLDGLGDATSQWLDDDELCVRLSNHHDRSTMRSTNGIFKYTEASGVVALRFDWFKKRDLYAILYYLSSVTAQLKSPSDSKAQSYLLEGLKMMKDDFSSVNIDNHDIMPASTTLTAATSLLQWRSSLEAFMRISLGLIHCNFGRWDEARKVSAQLKNASEYAPRDTAPVLQSWTQYLSAVISQGTGDTAAALKKYESLSSTIPQTSSTRIPSARDDIGVLAAMNTLLLINDPSHPQHQTAAAMTENLESLLQTHPNRALWSALHLLKVVYVDSASASTGLVETSILKRKQALQTALQVARSINNQQLLAIALGLMNDFFFKGLVGQQASKSLKTGAILAKQSGSPIWQAVAESMWAETIEREQDREGEARGKREAVGRIVEALPEKVREALTGKQEGGVE